MKYFCNICTLLSLVFFSHASAEAATLYIDPHETQIHPGDTISLAIRVDTDEGECVNVFDGTLFFTSNIVPVDVSLGNSILPVWVEPPAIDKENRQVTFAGGIPNGYCGRIDGDPRLTNIILELILQAPGVQIGTGNEGNVATISFGDQTTVLINDGSGTQAPLKTYGSTILIHEKPGNTIIDQWSARIENDNAPPSEFSVSLNQEPSVFGGKYFIVFNTTDKQSGIDHYEVIEEPINEARFFKWGGVDAPWVVARSPYVLSDQSLNSTIRVKAVDKKGNEYIATYIPEESIRGFQMHTLLIVGAIAGVIILLVLLILLVLAYRKRNILQSNLASDQNEIE